jgi:hypothetical protein
VTACPVAIEKNISHFAFISSRFQAKFREIKNKKNAVDFARQNV